MFITNVYLLRQLGGECDHVLSLWQTLVSVPSMLNPGLQENCTSVSYTNPVRGATLPSCGVPGWGHVTPKMTALVGTHCNFIGGVCLYFCWCDYYWHDFEWQFYLKSSDMLTCASRNRTGPQSIVLTGSTVGSATDFPSWVTAVVCLGVVVMDVTSRSNRPMWWRSRITTCYSWKIVIKILKCKFGKRDMCTNKNIAKMLSRQHSISVYCVLLDSQHWPMKPERQLQSFDLAVPPFWQLFPQLSVL